jgi:hypothetical protein
MTAHAGRGILPRLPGSGGESVSFTEQASTQLGRPWHAGTGADLELVNEEGKFDTDPQRDQQNTILDNLPVRLNAERPGSLYPACLRHVSVRPAGPSLRPERGPETGTQSSFSRGHTSYMVIGTSSVNTSHRLQ